jgi:parvulin-like peptidyl-prolyl isomerase
VRNLQEFFIFSLLCLSILPSSLHAEVIERVEAVINKKAIYKSDVTHFREQVGLRMKVDPIFPNEAIAKKEHPSDFEIVNFLVDESIISDKYPVTDSEVESEINSIQTNLKIDRDQLKLAIAREGYKFEDYYKLMRSSLSKRQLIDRDIRSRATVSDDDLKAEYNRQHAGSKSFLGSFHLFLLKFPKSDYKTAALAKAEADKALDAAQHSETFAGEDLGYLAYSDMTPALQKIVQVIGPEKMSGVFEDGDSYVIVKTGDIKSDIESAPEREKEGLRGHLMEFEFEHQIHLWLDRERSNNYVKINTQAP